MAAIPYHVARSFALGEEERAGNFRSTGDRLYTYDVCIARRTVEDGKIAIVTSNLDGIAQISPTSARHVRAARVVFQRCEEAGVAVKWNDHAAVNA